MACEEARTLLDSLMGGDRNAPLPSGAAVPLSKKQRLQKQADGEGSLLLPGRRSKSCYDKDIDPLYTAWGIDVYELFVNTKSDIGTNPNVVDRGAHEEFRKLPHQEQEALGYHYHLFQKLQELVRQCDRIVNRNQDKLNQEVQRKLSQRGGQDFVETVDEGAMDRLAMDLWQVEQLQISLRKQYHTLADVVSEEEEKKQALNHILKLKQEKRQKELESEAQETSTSEEGKDAVIEKSGEENHTVVVKQEDSATIKEEQSDEIGQHGTEDSPEKKRKRGEEGAPDEDDEKNQESNLQMDLGRITMQKQQILFDMANTISRLTPLQEAVEQQHKNLNYVKSDISTDKTVCQVSGNFMSSRDADERIAAHYAGKQYVGWKLVREKYKEMIQKYGCYGPPPPSNSRGGPQDGFGDDRRGGGGYGGRDHGGGDRRGHFPNGGSVASSGGPPRGGGGGGYGGPPRGGGDFHRRGPPPPSRGGGSWRR